MYPTLKTTFTSYREPRRRVGFSLFSTIGAALKNHLVNYPTSQHLYYIGSVGSVLGVTLVIQVITGVLLAMHYTPHIDLAFESVERIMREVPSGGFIRYLHSNGSSMLFILLYLHIGRGLYYQSYRAPKQAVGSTGVILFILMSGVAFLGYTLPGGQMSFGGATVITNIITAIPVIGSHIVTWVGGGFAINNNTLNRFFSLHYILSIIVLVLSALHLYLLHEVGSTSVGGRASILDLTRFFPYFFLKDLFVFLVFACFYLGIVFYKPNLFAHSDNYIRASAIVTPTHIVPEGYFLPFYAILKSIPNKLGGAVAMLGSMLILIILPGGSENPRIIADPKYKPLWDWSFNLLVGAFISLGYLGSKVLVGPILLLGQSLAVLYFAYYLIITIII